MTDTQQTLFFVYVLQSVHEPYHYYVGFTENVQRRLQAHNAGQDPSTARYKPWKIKTYLAFTDKEQALQFEQYLKTQSGRAFAKKRL